MVLRVNGMGEKGKKTKKWAQRNVNIQLKDQEVAEEQQCEIWSEREQPLIRDSSGRPSP